MSTNVIEMTSQEDELLDEIDEDGELRPEVGERLLRLRKERQAGKRGTPLTTIAVELSLYL